YLYGNGGRWVAGESAPTFGEGRRDAPVHFWSKEGVSKVDQPRRGAGSPWGLAVETFGDRTAPLGDRTVPQKGAVRPLLGAMHPRIFSSRPRGVRCYPRRG